MPLLEELADPSKIGDVDWFLLKFKDVVADYEEFSNKNKAAEAISLWSQRFLKSLQTQQGYTLSHTANAAFLQTLDSLLFLMVDRWSSGDPSYGMALRKSMHNLLAIREIISSKFQAERVLPKLVQHASDYRRDEPRVAFGSLEAIARSSDSFRQEVRDSISESFIHDAFEILAKEPSRSLLVGKCLIVILKSDPSAWFDYIRRYIGDNEHYQAIMTYFIEPLLKQHRDSLQVFQEFYEMCEPIRSPSVEIGILKAAKNARLDVSSLIQGSEAVHSSLSALSSNLRYDALELLCESTRKLTSPIPPSIYVSIMSNWRSLAAEGEPKLRAVVYSALNNLLIRVRTSKSEAEASSFINFLADWSCESLHPGMPYRCLVMATKILEVLVANGFKSEALSPKVVKNLVNCVISDYNDIRESSVSLLELVGTITDVETNFDSLLEQAFQLMQNSRTGDSGALLLEFLDERRPEMNIGDITFERLDNLVSAAEKDLELASRSHSIHGLIVGIRKVPPKNHKVVPLMRRIWRICTPPLTIVAPEGSSHELLNYCWKAIKESSSLIESHVSSSSATVHCTASEVDGIPTDEILSELSTMLIEITHRGAFTAIPPALISIARLHPEKVHSIVWDQIKALESRTHLRSVTRRSAGLPLLIVSALTVRFDDNIVEALFKLAASPFAENEDSELEMPQVHGMNSIKAIITDAGLAKQSSKFIENALELSFDRFESTAWSLRNCAAMMFSSLFRRIFGAKSLQVPASVFFQRYRKLKPLITQRLSNSSKLSELQSVYPALAILAMLQTVGATDESLSSYWESVVELLGSPSWKVREMSARAVVSMTHVDLVDDVVYELIRSMRLSDQNQLHGQALSVNGLLEFRRKVHNASEPSEEAKSKQSMSLTHLRNLISQNACMETQVELFKAWRNLGGQGRIVAFEDLPTPKFFNPSIDSFEAEQIQEGDVNTDVYDECWPQVLRNLPAARWNLCLATRVLKGGAQLPDLQAQCIKKLSTSSLVTELQELSFSLLSSSRPICVRQESLSLAASSLKEGESDRFDQLLGQVLEFSDDESPVESRYSALKSIGVILTEHKEKWYPERTDALLHTLFRLLSDDDKRVREESARITSVFMNLTPAKAPAFCEMQLLPLISKKFVARMVSKNLKADAVRARRNFDNPDVTLFAAEKESQYRDTLRYISIQSEFCEPDEASRQEAAEAGKILEDLDFSLPLGAAANFELVEIMSRINAIKSN